MSVVLGIHDGHNATAALLRDGRVEAAVSEGRMIREKQEPGYPWNAIEEVMEIGDVDPGDLDRIALSSKFMHPKEFYREWDWYRKNYRDQIREEQENEEREQYYLEQRQDERLSKIENHLGVDRERVEIVEHHVGHAASAHYGAPWDENFVVFTLDGSGDGLCATVSVVDGSGSRHRTVTQESHASLGKVYSRVTFLLGMQPWRHEYEVMGMAPYAEQEFVDRVRPILDPLVEVDGQEFRCGTHLSTNYCYGYLRSNLENKRFDWICGAVQQWLEDRMCEWVRNVVEETGIRRVACAGGVFMNVKANQKIREMDEVEELWIHPSCGDNSLAIGAAQEVSNQMGDEPEPLDTIYWGPQYSRSDVENALEETDGVSVREPASTSSAVAELLADGHVVANYLGRMEWGARALGNRSILADPRDRSTVRKINERIKERDFWLPFAPSILSEHASRYVDGWTEDDEAPYMIRAFDTTDEGCKDLAAALHPYDDTIRPQVVRKKDNFPYWSILREFCNRTGVGGVLNTSFNMSGHPIVRTPEDALDVLKRSGLRYLRIGPFLVEDTE